MPTRWMPGVFGTCAQYIAPNLPAPISPRRSGRPCAARSQSFVYRFMNASGLAGERWLQRRRGGVVLPRQGHVVVLEQTVVGQALNGGEVPVRNILRPLEAPDVVRYRTQAQVDTD